MVSEDSFELQILCCFVSATHSVTFTQGAIVPKSTVLILCECLLGGCVVSLLIKGSPVWASHKHLAGCCAG